MKADLFVVIMCLFVGLFAFSCSSGGGSDDDDDDAADDDAADDDAADDDASDDDTADDDDDDAAPTVVSINPDDGETEVPLASTIVVTFSEPMDAATVEQNFNLGSLSGAFDWNADESELTFTPADLLTEGETFTVFIGSGAADRNGVPMATSFSSSFQAVDLWTMTFNSANNEADSGNDIALDGDGNIYLTGSFSVAGQEENIWVHAMDPSGTELWTRSVNGPASDTDNGNGIFVDATDNVYVVGDIGQSVGEFDVWVRKYDAFTTEQWTQTYGDISLGFDYGNGVSVDADGNVIVCGRTGVGAADWDILIRKYGPTGVIQWMRAYDGGLNEFDGCNDVATDAAGNIFVVGVTGDVNGQGSNVWVRKLDGDGTPQWTKTHNGAANMADVGFGIAIDADGYVYVAGSEWIDGQYANIWVRKYDANGNVEWTVTKDGDDHQSDQANDVAVDTLGNVYVTGKIETLDEFAGIWVAKYDSEGNELWTDLYQAPDQGADVGNGLALDIDANVYVIGTIYTDAGNRNIWLRKYDTNGNWAD